MVECLVANCHNTYKNKEGKGESFHKLPEHENLKKIWLAKIKREGGLPKPEVTLFTNIGNRLTVVNFTFTILHEKDVATLAN